MKANSNCYWQGLRNMLDEHAPETLCRVTERNPTPWTSDEIRSQKQD